MGATLEVLPVCLQFGWLCTRGTSRVLLRLGQEATLYVSHQQCEDVKPPTCQPAQLHGTLKARIITLGEILEEAGPSSSISLLDPGSVRMKLVCISPVLSAAFEMGIGDLQGSAVVKQLDLADLKSVQALAADINATEARLDLLLLNAGVMACPKSYTKQNFEIQMGTNHFGHALLLQLLLEKMKAQVTNRLTPDKNGESEQSIVKFMSKQHWKSSDSPRLPCDTSQHQLAVIVGMQ